MRIKVERRYECRKMQDSVEVKASPAEVWAAWERAYQRQGGGKMSSGQTLKTEGTKSLSFRIEDVKEGERFSLLWKSLWLRLCFSHEVVPTKEGSKITYSFAVRGFLSLPVRWLLRKKLSRNLSLVLRSFAKGIGT